MKFHFGDVFALLVSSRTEMSTPAHFTAWKSILRWPLYAKSRFVGVSQFIASLIPSGSDCPPENARISILGCDPAFQFRYTKVASGPGATNPPFANASAVATIVPSGDRDSADQIRGDLQPDTKTQAPTIMSEIALRIAQIISDVICQHHVSHDKAQPES